MIKSVPHNTKMDDDFFLPSAKILESSDDDLEESQQSTYFCVADGRITEPDSFDDEQIKPDDGEVTDATEIIPVVSKDSKKKERENRPKKSSKDTKKKGTIESSKEKEDPREGGKKNILQVLKFFVRKGRVFEIRRLRRRIQQLKKKKGSEQEILKNERKISRLMMEVEVLRNFSIEGPCEKYSKGLEEKFEFLMSITENGPVEHEWLTTLKGDSNSKDDLCYILKLLSMKSVAAKFESNLNDLLKESYVQRSLVRSENISIKAGTSEKWKRKDVKESKHIKDQSNFKRKRKRKRSEVVNGEEKIGDKKLNKEFVNLENTESDKNERNDFVDCCNKGKHLKDERGKMKNLNKNGEKKKARKKDQNGFNTNFGSNDQKMKKFKEKLQKLKNRKENRLGQRARRELWEKMYGEDAEHMKKGLKFGRKDRLNKHRRKGEGNLTNEGGPKGSNRLLKSKKERTTHESNLHPSWQAKKLQKQQNKIVQFEGSKIKFDD